MTAIRPTGRLSMRTSMGLAPPSPDIATAGRFVAFEDSDAALTADIPGDTLTCARVITAFAYPGPPRPHRATGGQTKLFLNTEREPWPQS